MVITFFRKVGLADFFSAFLKGLKTNIIEKGLTLPARQKQLIAIARALLKKSRNVNSGSGNFQY